MVQVQRFSEGELRAMLRDLRVRVKDCRMGTECLCHQEEWQQIESYEGLLGDGFPQP